jgi:hypothetical protein
MLAAMAWTLVEFDEPCLFTSGHPVVYLVETPPPPMMGVGFGAATPRTSRSPRCAP